MQATFVKWHSLSVGAYVWIVTIFSGATLLDIVYANTPSIDHASPVLADMFSSGADFLLFLGMLAFPIGVVAVAVSWKREPSRNLFIASLCLLAVEFLMPVLFGSVLQQAQFIPVTRPGMWIRLLVSGLSSILAVIGLIRSNLTPSGNFSQEMT